MKQLFTLLLITLTFSNAFSAVSQYRVTGKNNKNLREFNGFVSAHIIPIDTVIDSQSNSYSVGYTSNSEPHKINKKTGMILNGFSVNSLMFDFKIINDTTIQIYSLNFCCDGGLGEELLYKDYTKFRTWSEKIGDKIYENKFHIEHFIIKLNITATLRNGYELHLDIPTEDRKILDKTNIFKMGYLSDVMYLYNTEYVSIN